MDQTERAAPSWPSLSLLNAYWIPLAIEDAALMAIAVPAALVRLAPGDYRGALAVLASLVAICSMIVPPIAGAVSDRRRQAGENRRSIVFAGAALNVVGLLLMTVAPNVWTFGACVVLAYGGSNVSMAAYQAMLPDGVPRSSWGVAAGFRGVATLIGTVVGLTVASTSVPNVAFVVTACIVGFGALTLFAISEREPETEDRATVRDWDDFAVVFVARCLIVFGMTLLMTFVLYFFQDILKVGDPSAGTGFVAGFALIGAIVSSIASGWLSDRMPRKIVVAIAGIPMTLAALGFALQPHQNLILIFAGLFGLGYGAIISTGWALVLDAVPEMRDAARDLGVWGIASNLPAVFAPPIGWLILARFGGTLPGYQWLFGTAALSFALASLVTLAVRGDAPKPLATKRSTAFFFTAIAVIAGYYHTAYRIRGWGRLPFRRGSTLVLVNHQHDFDTNAIIPRLALQGPWRQPIFSVASRRMFEPGFMAGRIPWLRGVLRGIDASGMFRALGLQPIENELRVRTIASYAHAIRLRHGDLSVDDVFVPGLARSLRESGAQTLAGVLATGFFLPYRERASLSDVLQPYRSELLAAAREQLNADFDHLVDVQKTGVTMFLAPEGRYSIDGTMHRFGGALPRLAPHADIYLAGMSYDPFASRRLSLLYTLAKAAGTDSLERQICRLRPVTISALIATWLPLGDAPFGERDAIAGVDAVIAALPSEAFLDPEVRRNSAARVRATLAAMRKSGILSFEGGAYRTTDRRADDRFPIVSDMISYQRAFLAETLAAFTPA